LVTVCRGRKSCLRTGGGSTLNAVQAREDPWLKVMILLIFIRWRKSGLGFLWKVDYMRSVISFLVCSIISRMNHVWIIGKHSTHYRWLLSVCYLVSWCFHDNLLFCRLIWWGGIASLCTGTVKTGVSWEATGLLAKVALIGFPCARMSLNNLS